MIRINEKNGFIYIYGLKEQLDWCDIVEEQDGSITNYFLLNVVTKRYFKETFLPLIRENKVVISQELFDYVRLFEQNPTNNSLELSDDIIRYMIPTITLKDHQVKALRYMYSHNSYGFFYGPGTGKTLIAIAWLYHIRPETCLIVTPQKVVGQYKDELNKYLPGNNYDVTNFEQLHKIVELHKSQKRRSFQTNVLKKYDAIIIDESHRAKNYSSEINIRLRELAKYATYKYLFTGSPQDKSRHDILAQLAIIDPKVMPTKTKTLERYFRIDDYYNPKNEIRERKHELTEVIKCYTIAEKTEDVVELTESNSFIIKCPHPSALYDQLFNDRVLNSIDYKDIHLDNYECVCDTPSLLRTSLKEICSGLLTIKEITSQKPEWFILDSPKVNELDTLVKKINNGIIYYEFTLSTSTIETVLKQNNKTYVIVNGKISAKKSHDKIESFKRGDVDYLIIQSKSGNAGLDLTNVHDIIFYSLPDSFIVYEQCKHRIRRIGQTKECNYYYLLCEDTIEEKIYETLQRKKSFNDKVFNQLLKEK